MLKITSEEDLINCESLSISESGSVMWRYGDTIGNIMHEHPLFETALGMAEPFDTEAHNAAVARSEALADISRRKLSAYEFKGVTCSVKEEDQNGWEVVNSRINELLSQGVEWRPIPFLMENGNVVMIETHQEWNDFREAGWSAREALMNEKAALM